MSTAWLTLGSRVSRLPRLCLNVSKKGRGCDGRQIADKLRYVFSVVPIMNAPVEPCTGAARLAYMHSTYNISYSCHCRVCLFVCRTDVVFVGLTSVTVALFTAEIVLQSVAVEGYLPVPDILRPSKWRQAIADADAATAASSSGGGDGDATAIVPAIATSTALVSPAATSASAVVMTAPTASGFTPGFPSLTAPGASGANVGGNNRSLSNLDHDHVGLPVPAVHASHSGQHSASKATSALARLHTRRAASVAAVKASARRCITAVRTFRWSRLAMVLRSLVGMCQLGSFYFWLDCLATASMVLELVGQLADAGLISPEQAVDLSATQAGMNMARAGKSPGVGVRCERALKLLR